LVENAFFYQLLPLHHYIFDLASPHLLAYLLNHFDCLVSDLRISMICGWQEHSLQDVRPSRLFGIKSAQQLLVNLHSGNKHPMRRFVKRLLQSRLQQLVHNVLVIYLGIFYQLNQRLQRFILGSVVQFFNFLKQKVNNWLEIAHHCLPLRTVLCQL
jgi:hypothetical protein